MSRSRQRPQVSNIRVDLLSASTFIRMHSLIERKAELPEWNQERSPEGPLFLEPTPKSPLDFNCAPSM